MYPVWTEPGSHCKATFGGLGFSSEKGVAVQHSKRTPPVPFRIAFDSCCAPTQNATRLRWQRKLESAASASSSSPRVLTARAALLGSYLCFKGHMVHKGHVDGVAKGLRKSFFSAAKMAFSGRQHTDQPPYLYVYIYIYIYIFYTIGSYMRTCTYMYILHMHDMDIYIHIYIYTPCVLDYFF